MSWLLQHWYSEIVTAWTVFNFIMNGIAQSLDAPTAQSTSRDRFWFKFVNYCALNSKRGKNGAPRVEDSPNFQAAAEAYMQNKISSQQGALKQ